MSDEISASPVLIEFYEQYLADPESAAFIKRVSGRYTVATLERLAEWGNRMARRAAVLALGFLGDYSSNHILGRALIDRDRGVRNLADRGIRNIWRKMGDDGERDRLETIIRLNASKQYDQAIDLATRLIHLSPWLAEAWNQRGVAHFNRKEYDDAIRDCHQTLELNPYHFPAAVGMGKCYLHLSNRVAALESMRRALRLNPGLDDVRAHVVYLQRALKEE